jgi:uncharacterized membrane protein YbhN (UPF0104 family)
MVRWKKQYIRLVASVVFTLFVGVFVWRNWSHAVESFRVLGSVPLTQFWIAIPLVGLTFVLAAFSYSFLGFARLRVRELIVVELAAAFVNRLIPSGLGGLGVHGLYLRRRKHSVAQATAVVSINNLLGMLVHVSLLAAVVAAGIMTDVHLGFTKKQGWIILGVALAVLLLAATMRIRTVVARFLRNLFASLRTYERQPHRLVYAALSLLAMTGTYLVILHLAALSFGVSLTATELFIVYTAGVLVGTVVPTPGGLAGVEAGLVGGFMAYGVASPTAVAIALAFRLVTYWLPIIPGALCLYVARHRRLV